MAFAIRDNSSYYSTHFHTVNIAHVFDTFSYGYTIQLYNVVLYRTLIMRRNISYNEDKFKW